MKIINVLIISLVTVCLIGLAVGLTGRVVSYNLSREVDNFNVVRQITVINCIKGDTVFQMTGKMSITADVDDNQLEVVVEDNGTYTKHFIGLSDNVTYVVEYLNLGKNDVSNYHYTINFNPKMWLPIGFDTID